MELREFAESILFADSLEAKLARPGTAISDEAPGPAIKLPEHPERPEALRFDRKDSPPPLPGLHTLEDEAQRGILLHFFANHELLATELMALVLLKFPDAPREFREGVYETLREEQHHTTWYLRRMAECGVEFGDYPVNGFFWNAVAPMETPMDYVSRLSLTFEQANLDYSRNYAKVFRDSGDLKSARILEKIYRDEISHVSYGLKWFRHWKQEDESDWEAFERQLDFPLSPSRAKANSPVEFNTDGRFEVGLDADFVRRLQLFQRSKGRTPRIFWFCPDPENAMTRLEYHPRKTVENLAADLEILAAFVASHEDVVLMNRVPSLEHRERLQGYGFTLPEFVERDAIGTLTERKLAELRPWAWCPQSAELLAELEPNLPKNARRIAECWNEKTRTLYSKANDVAWSMDFARQHPLPFVDPAQIGEIVDDADSIEAPKTGELLLKAPFGASGQRNHVWQGEPTRRWAEKIIEHQGCVIVEPRLKRVFDFSVQYEMTREGLKKLDFVRLENNLRGQFLAAQCGPKPCQALPPELARFLGQFAFPLYGRELRDFLESKLEAIGYLGPIGVDALVYRDRKEALALKPIVEINPRYTMGRLAVELRKRIAPDQCVRLEFAKACAESEDPAGTMILNEAESVAVKFRVARRHADLLNDGGSTQRVGGS
tara:strand:+ start:4098 stop:6083 length:1986 start_codon:yes stop_codon:yes gene_type:complete